MKAAQPKNRFTLSATETQPNHILRLWAGSLWTHSALSFFGQWIELNAPPWCTCLVALDGSLVSKTCGIVKTSEWEASILQQRFHAAEEIAQLPNEVIRPGKMFITSAITPSELRWKTARWITWNNQAYQQPLDSPLLAAFYQYRMSLLHLVAFFFLFFSQYGCFTM